MTVRPLAARILGALAVGALLCAIWTPWHVRWVFTAIVLGLVALIVEPHEAPTSHEAGEPCLSLVDTIEEAP